METELNLIRRENGVSFPPYEDMTKNGILLEEAMADSRLRAGGVRLEFSVLIPGKSNEKIRIGIRIGEEKLYVVRDILSFLDSFDSLETISYGKGFVWQPAWMYLPDSERKLLEVLRETMASAALSRDKTKCLELRFISLPDIFTRKFLSLLKYVSFRIILTDGSRIMCSHVKEQALPVFFFATMTPTGIIMIGELPEGLIPLTNDYSYILYDNEVLELPVLQRETVSVLKKRQHENKTVFSFPLNKTAKVISEIIPYLKMHNTVEMSHELQSRIMNIPVQPIVFLDRDGRNIRGKIRFRYGSNEINPFSSISDPVSLEKDEKLLLRDMEREQEILDEIGMAGFRLHDGEVLLTDKNDIYSFITDKIKKLQKICDVYLSQEFRKMSPRRPTLSGNVRLEGDQLKITLMVDGQATDELLQILQALGQHKKYYRMKDGSYLDLSVLQEWEETAEAISEAAYQDGAEINRDFIQVKSFRMQYLTTMLKEKNLSVSFDDNIIRATGDDVNVPSVTLCDTDLRPYQQRGYAWLYDLSRMHMGGIMADDMGLGKTIQVIALLQKEHEQGVPSIVVAPTSLTYNWFSEIRKFAPTLRTIVVNGTANQRNAMIRRAMEAGDIDVLIISYPLIRRDIEVLKEFRFKVAILDEAQYIKNAASLVAVSVKQLQASARFALTGTPLENGIGELWSIFDFILPGYLPGYHTFIRRFQDEGNVADLKKRIQPFLIRRLKQDVLQELPEKLETTMMARMTPEQEKIYQAAMLRLKPRIDEVINSKGMNRGRIEILSAITELREICCHPSLVMDQYAAGSGKEEMLVELLPELIASGRRILLFSQFTGMLKILKRRLEDERYSVMYMDGETPADERLGLTETFNNGNTQIFLISLRTGGAGLNLTGADTVIHYDPWWNPAAEDQATDRAHRMGQRKSVEVIRLVTAESIEEQVVALGKQKKALFEDIISPGETTFHSLSVEDIRALFS